MSTLDAGCRGDAAHWTDLGDVIFTPERMDAAADEVNKVMELLDITAGCKILDMPCGPGRHSTELAGHGLEVTGIDATPAFVDAAKARCKERKLKAEFDVGDMRTFCRPEGFDIVLNLFTSFGYFHDDAENLAVAKNFFNNLRPGGEVLIDMMGKENIARIFQPRDWRQTEDGTYVLEERQISEDWNWIDVTWTVIKGGKQRQVSCGHRIYSASELKRTLIDAGFIEVSVYGNLDGADYDLNAERLVVTALKP